MRLYYTGIKPLLIGDADVLGEDDILYSLYLIPNKVHLIKDENRISDSLNSKKGQLNSLVKEGYLHQLQGDETIEEFTNRTTGKKAKLESKEPVKHDVSIVVPRANTDMADLNTKLDTLTNAVTSLVGLLAKPQPKKRGRPKKV